MQVQLHKKAAFEAALRDYHPSDETLELLKKMPLVILQGISASGRNTLIDYLVANREFHQIVSDTTRPPKVRNGALEKDGVHYFFRSEEDLLHDLEQGTFLEAEIIHDQQVSGISVRELVRAYESGKVPINEVAREGVDNIRRIKPNSIFFFVVPPNYDVWLSRLKAREVMSEAELMNRKYSAILEIEAALAASDFLFVTNDSVEDAADAIVAGYQSHTDTEKDNAARDVAKQILERLKN